MCGLTFVLFVPTDHAKTKLCLQGFDEQEGADGYAHFRPHESADRCVIGGILFANPS